MIRNDNADEVRPGWGVFAGRWSIVPFIAGACFISLMNISAFMGLDLVSSLIFALSPATLMTVAVIVFVNQKPPGYPLELAQMFWFRGHEWLYIHGYTDEPPQIWYSGKPVRHPRS